LTYLDLVVKIERANQWYKRGEVVSKKLSEDIDKERIVVSEDRFIDNFKKQVSVYGEKLHNAFCSLEDFNYIDWNKVDAEDEDMLAKCFLIIFLRLLKLPLSDDLKKYYKLIKKSVESTTATEQNENDLSAETATITGYDEYVSEKDPHKKFEMLYGHKTQMPPYVMKNKKNHR